MMNININGPWLVAEPNTTDHPGVTWVLLSTIERINVVARDSNRCASISVVACGKEIVVKTGYLGNPAAKSDAAFLANAIASQMAGKTLVSNEAKNSTSLVAVAP